MKILILILVFLTSINAWTNEDTQLIGQPTTPAVPVAQPDEMPEPIKKTENPKGAIIKPTKEQLKTVKKIKKTATDAASKTVTAPASADNSKSSN